MTEGATEILLLLCCLVGAVAFVCFAMGAVTLGTAIDADEQYDLDALTDEHDSLRSEVEARMQLLSELRKELEDLERLRASAGSAEERGNLRLYKREHDSLRAVRSRLEAELREMRSATTIRADDGPASELQAMDERLVGLRDSLENLQAKDELEDITDLDLLRQQVVDAQRRIEMLRAAPPRGEVDENTFNPYAAMAGARRFSSPLFVECVGSRVVFHPDEETLGVYFNPFPSRTESHDAVVVMVRPSGLEVFGNCVGWAEHAGLPLCYEPIDEGWSLDFARP